MTSSALKAAHSELIACYRSLTALITSTQEVPVRRVLSGYAERLARDITKLERRVAKEERRAQTSGYGGRALLPRAGRGLHRQRGELGHTHGCPGLGCAGHAAAEVT